MSCLAQSQQPRPRTGRTLSSPGRSADLPLGVPAWGQLLTGAGTCVLEGIPQNGEQGPKVETMTLHWDPCSTDVSQVLILNQLPPSSEATAAVNPGHRLRNAP